jgi:hypothetical protein
MSFLKLIQPVIPHTKTPSSKLSYAVLLRFDSHITRKLKKNAQKTSILIFHRSLAYIIAGFFIMETKRKEYF